MKAAFIKAHGGPEVLEYGDVPTPSVGPGQVKVKIKYASINHLDVWVRKGLPGLKLSYPHILCGDGAGIVEEVGSDVRNAKKGMEVIVHPGVSCGKCEACTSGWESLCRDYKILGEHIAGNSAEYIVVSEANVFAKPANLDFKGAASLPLVFTTAWQMVVTRGEVKRGEWVVVHSAGSGVGSAAIQIAKLFGAKIIATAGSDGKLAHAKKMGAEHGINYQTQDFAAEIKRLTEKRGADLIIDHLGEAYWEKNIQSLRWGGRIVLCGATSGPRGVVDLRQVFYKQLSILGSTMGSKRDFPLILTHFAKGDFVPVVDRAFPLPKVREAHEYLESRAQFGKVLLEV